MSTSTSTSTTTDPPPPDYVPSQPQILITPLPDSASFFWGKTIQGEIYVKGLGEGSGNRTGIVKSLSVQLSLTNHLPNHPTIHLHEFPIQTLYTPSTPISNVSSSTIPSDGTIPFSTSHRFSIQLPTSLASSLSEPLPGTLNLTSYEKGEIRYTLSVKLVLPNDQVVIEEMKIEGTPQEVSCQGAAAPQEEEELEEVEERLEKDGVLARLLIDQARPRLGDLLRLGLEIRPAERKKTGVIGLAKQSDPIETLRPLRRVRVELFRKVIIHSTQPNHIASSSTSSSTIGQEVEHLTLLHATGKSLRYPGSGPGRHYPPLRVLFTIPTAQLGVVAEQTWGEITSNVPYHDITFFIRVTIGFGDVSPTGTSNKDWTLRRSITIRPKKWKEPREIVVDRGLIPDLGNGNDSPLLGQDTEAGTSQVRRASRSGSGSGTWTEEDFRKEAYRQKGRDVVGDSGTFRYTDTDTDTDTAHNDLPPPFEVETQTRAGPSNSSSSGPGELPSFLESEEQARTGEIPTLNQTVRSERLVPVNFNQDDQVVVIPEEVEIQGHHEGTTGEEGFERNTWVGRRGSLGGELGTWVEYDGYETFSVAPPSMDASYGAGGAMDPPQEGDENSVNVVGGMVARLGLEGEGARMQGLELMEHLGLGEGTRIVDLQDDLPPGIDEPSLPALPDFHSHVHVHAHGHTHDDDAHSPPPPPAHAPYISPPAHSHSLPPAHDPPSFDASQAANAVGVAATSHIRSQTGPNVPVGVGGRRPSRHAIDDAVGVGHVSTQGDAPPGYERAGGEGGLPPYS
ncbi:hypothetical protein I203_106725 [Kwoniella mangroviensis CBS 8507]|uniref:uncharacterized protein n=1 Tax=Kwoniella mangroviensis CBS 8507 TaxID=1296122 RepID=UPI00080D7C6E|nr:uncharacterized protein I203_07813 [Kwoniella mangroviensis CBS 8507]OCF63077.1 hypothetical protein I203_07813 [Kwoniella mangroviensis CBS 8507]